MSIPAEHPPRERTRSLADAIARDLLRRDESPVAYPACFVCGRAYTKGDGRFCSGRCRAGFDAGLPAFEPSRTVRHGFLVNCAGCRKQFDSKGLRCCSIECERRYREREQLDAESGRRPLPSGQAQVRRMQRPHSDLAQGQAGLVGHEILLGTVRPESQNSAKGP